MADDQRLMASDNSFPEFNLLDITDPGVPIEIVIRHDGQVIWVNVGHKCALRICQINEEIIIRDNRKAKYMKRKK